MPTLRLVALSRLVVASVALVGCDGSQAQGGVSGDALPEGPTKCQFDKFAPAGSTVDWTIQPAGAHAAAAIVSAPFCTAGMFCRFSKDENIYDVSGYDTVEIDAVVPVGQAFDVSLGRGSGLAWHGCNWNLTGKGDAIYTIDLSHPNYCGPTMCQFDLQVQGLALNAPYGSEAGTSADIEVRRIEFLKKGSGTGTTQLASSGYGPDGACWYLAPWGDPVGSWAGPLTSSAARVTDGGSLTRELSGVDLSDGSIVEIDANFEEGSVVAVKLTDRTYDPGPNSCWWHITGIGASTYTLDDLSSPVDCWGPSSLDLTDLQRIEFAGSTSTVVEVNSVRIVKP